MDRGTTTVRGTCRAVLAGVLSVVIAASVIALAEQPSSAATTWAKGDVFAGVSGGQYKVFSGTGAYKETITSGTGGYTTGCAFNGALTRLYTTSFSSGNVVAYGDASPHTIAQTIPTGRTPESISFAASGGFFVGGPGSPDLQEYNAAGTLVDSDNVAGELTGGPDWIDLAKDQKTVFYTSEGRTIFRFDAASDTQLAPFATLTGFDNAFALRLLSPYDGTGGLLVADRSEIKRLNGAGAVVQTYDAPNEDFWFALNLDPNGTSFWSGDATTGNFYRFNIQTGAVEVGPIASGAPGNLFGLCVRGEITAAQPDTSAPSCKLTRTFAGPPRGIDITVRDGLATDTGLKSITVTKNVNANVVVPAFAQGTKSAVVITATRVDNSLASQVELTVTDVRGNKTTCDPVLTTLVRELKPQVFTGVPGTEHLVTVDNGPRGLRRITVEVNGTTYQRRLAPDQSVTIDVAASLRAGDVNSFSLRGWGPGSAEITIWDGL